MNLTALDSIRWGKLVPWSIGVALIASAGIGATVPRPLVSQTTCCIGCSGNLCKSTCVRECTDGSCCEWDFYYKKTSEDNPDPPVPET